MFKKTEDNHLLNNGWYQALIQSADFLKEMNKPLTCERLKSNVMETRLKF